MNTKALESTSILIIDNNQENFKFLKERFQHANFNVSTASNGEEALEIVSQKTPDIILLDIYLPGIDGFQTCHQLKQESKFGDRPVIFLSVANQPIEKIKGFSLGCVDYITKPFEYEEVLARVNLHLNLYRQQQQLMEKNAALLRINQQLQQEIARREQPEQTLSNVTTQSSMTHQEDTQNEKLLNFIGESSAIKSVLEEIRRLQPIYKVNILILGESGTGKELIARAIHFGSIRSKGPFVPVNCSAIPEHLAESSFFGHVKGAFTSASSNHQGYFEQAQKGCLFLDEIGDMPWSLQAKLLRALETGVITPVGSHQDRRIDVRIIAATSVNLKADNKQFREDLYFRLTGYTIIAPPLRERQEDIMLLANHFLSTLASEIGYKTPKLTPQVEIILTNYYFPGNVRELRNMMQQALIKSEGNAIEPHHLYFAPFVNEEMREIEVPEEKTKYLINLTPDERKVMDYIAKNGSINNTQCRELLQFDLHRASYLLKKMHQKGLLKRKSKLQWAVYCLNVEW